MKLVPEFTGWWPDIGKKLPMEISVRKGLDRYGCKTSENTLREFSLVIATVANVSRKRRPWLIVHVNHSMPIFPCTAAKTTVFTYPSHLILWSMRLQPVSFRSGVP